jgi:hypothetical protein
MSMDDDGLYLGPCAPGTENTWTEEQLAAFAAEWRRKYAGPRPKLLTPLPRRVRLRLWCARQVDRAAIRLVDRGRYAAAERLWRAFGMWR